ncbi:MAG: c-type cytochrome [Anaerolineae bacterium]|nr:c-type cytochrome [Anaerolineae bacterium]
MNSHRALALIFIILGVVTAGCGFAGLTFSTAKQADDTVVNAAYVPGRTLSPNAALIATANAAPFRPTRVPPTAEVAQLAEDSTAAVLYDSALIEAGQTSFTAYCSACHGPDAKGIAGLGKDLVASEFVHSLTDEELLNFVKTGRPIWDAANTTGVDMPPKGGNPGLTDEDILNIIAYLRTLNAGASTENPVSAYDPAVLEAGSAAFTAYCSACHGPDARGIAGLGKDLVASEFVHSLTDEELLNFVKTGRPIWDAANTTGVDMPPKGGNPGLTDEELLNIVMFIRSLGQ